MRNVLLISLLVLNSLQLFGQKADDYFQFDYFFEDKDCNYKVEFKDDTLGYYTKQCINYTKTGIKIVMEDANYKMSIRKVSDNLYTTSIDTRNVQFRFNRNNVKNRIDLILNFPDEMIEMASKPIIETVHTKIESVMPYQDKLLLVCPGDNYFGMYVSKKSKEDVDNIMKLTKEDGTFAIDYKINKLDVIVVNGKKYVATEL